jgi:hypothetical protein
MTYQNVICLLRTSKVKKPTGRTYGWLLDDIQRPGYVIGHIQR